MASTYSTNLALELIGTGDQAGSWGNTTNTNLGTLIEQAISGYVTQAMTTGNDTTITIPNGATGVARNMYIEMTGTGGAATNLIVPANKKLYFIYNNTTGAVTVKVSGQTGVSVASGSKVILVSNGTDIVAATSYSTGASAGGSNTQVQYNSSGSFAGSANLTFNGTTLTANTLNLTNALGTAYGGTGSTSTTYCSLTANVSGTLPVGNGGTGQTTYTNGQLLIGNTTGNTLTKSTLTAGSGITITNGAGSITIAASGGGGGGSAQDYIVQSYGIV